MTDTLNSRRIKSRGPDPSESPEDVARRRFRIPEMMNAPVLMGEAPVGAIEGVARNLATRAIAEGTKLAAFRSTRWFQLGEDIVEVARRGAASGGSNVAARGFSPGRLVARIVDEVPKYARRISGD